MQEETCKYNIIKKTNNKTLSINCRNCEIGKSTIFDEKCRKNILQILRTEHGIDQLILNHIIVKVFTGEQLELLKQLTQFIEDLNIIELKNTTKTNSDICKKCNQNRKKDFERIKETSKKDPISAINLLEKQLQNKKTNTACINCEKDYKEIIKKIIKKAEFKKDIIEEKIDSEKFYTNYIRPYVRPGFIDSYIQLDPPPDAVFLESYNVSDKKRRPVQISHYTLKSRPEKLYFVVPPEYDLPQDELILLEKVRSYLSDHRPKDASFMDAETSREYFQSFGKKIISKFSKEDKIDISTDRIEYLSDVFARYTAGFGILEDLLLDAKIQDIYVNAPVTNNPLHIIVDGEEYTSNVYLSNRDIDAIASRFRTLSGRAFSEASPVLDMDLNSYNTRVAAISNPLTPKGIAFALRKHRKKPWTLSHFIKNNMISAETAGLLGFLIDGQASVLVAGSRGAGKTSLLSALILEIPQRFRILTIEDTAEIPVEILQKKGYKIQSLITKSISSGNNASEINPTDALRTALRLGESVLILGEVRGVEAKVLFEAMRVGAAGNLIMGTIHGSTTRDVYERIVYDIGIPPTSFKAVDSVVIAAPIRKEGGIERVRRVTQISEINKSSWDKEPDPDKVFRDIMKYDAAKDSLISTNLLDTGQSEIIRNIAKKWGITVEKALENIKLRVDIKKEIVKHSDNNQYLLEAKANRDANNCFWTLIEESKKKHKEVDYNYVRSNWMKWFKDYIRI